MALQMLSHVIVRAYIYLTYRSSLTQKSARSRTVRHMEHWPGTGAEETREKQESSKDLGRWEQDVTEPSHSAAFRAGLSAVERLVRVSPAAPNRTRRAVICSGANVRHSPPRLGVPWPGTGVEDRSKIFALISCRAATVTLNLARLAASSCYLRSSHN